MTINRYFSTIKIKIEKGEYRIKRTPELKNIPIKLKSPYLESIDYLIYEYLKSRRDNRIKVLFDYIVVPNDTDTLFDFNKITFEDFFRFLTSIKDR